MTFSKIISELYTSDELDACISRMVKTDHREDFKQELFLILSQLPQDRVFQLHKDGKLKFYTVRIIINLSRQINNTYHRIYNDRRVEYNTGKVSNHEHVENGEQEREAQEREAKILFEIEHKLEEKFGSWYYTELIKAIVKHGSMREASRATFIPVTTISDSIKKVRQHLESI